jgi:hypothetical protein
VICGHIGAIKIKHAGEPRLVIDELESRIVQICDR